MIDLLLEYFGASAARFVGVAVELQNAPLLHARLTRRLYGFPVILYWKCAINNEYATISAGFLNKVDRDPIVEDSIDRAFEESRNNRISLNPIANLSNKTVIRYQFMMS